MGRADGTDPALFDTPVPIDGDGAELIGRVIDGRYRLDATLGRGGMGLVYRGTHMGMRRQVAVKILHPSLAASPEVRNRFEREALAVGKIDHPNCVSVYDVGRLPDGSLYLAMELLEGKSLADVLEQEGQIAPGRALHVLAGILRGLAHIHHAKLIHRDIKPENIFLIRHGQDEDFAKILDFGIAKPMTASDLDDGVKLTQAGMAFGTPIYMAPEQALGNPMDGRADLYAAAIIGYEMLCGQPPFYSEDKLEVMSMHTAKPVPPMRMRMIKGGRPVPSSIERLIARGLTKKPSDRYASAEVFLAEVEEALHTPDGGVTDVNFERPEETGARPLIDELGQLRMEDDVVERSGAIAEAIDEALSTPVPPMRVVPKPATPPTGTTAPATVGAPRAAVSMPVQRDSAPRFGVGLGLPYTGPGGVPIFGLTPEQRLGRSDPDKSIASMLEPEPKTTVRGRKPRWWLYGAIAAAAIIVGVIVAVMTSRTPKEPPADEMDPASIAGRANEEFEHGNIASALKILESNEAAIGSDPRAQLVLGHVRAARNENGLALAAYDKALRLLPALETNAKLRAALRTMAGNQSDYAVVAQALDLWVGRTTDPEAKRVLLLSAVHDDIGRRKAVRPVIERRKLGDDVDWLKAYSLDLDQDYPCEARKEAVSKLRALGDIRAVAPLERAIYKRGKAPPYKNKPLNTCLIEEAKLAIGYLKGLPKKQ